MKIKCNKESIKKGIQIVENIVSSSTIKPILQNIKIDATKELVVISATDLEVSISYTINPIEVIETGVIVCPISKIAPIIKEWSNDYIEITEKDKICTITSENDYFKVLCADPSEFPTIPVFTEENFVEIDKNFLIDMIKKTSFIVMGEKAKYSSNGIYLEIAENRAKMVANDGRRLSEVKRKVNNITNLKSSCIIPMKGVSNMVRMLPEQDEVIKLKIDDKRILIKTENATMCSQLIEGQYPEYEEVIPTDLDKKIILDKEVFTTAVRRSAVMTTEEYKLLRFVISDNLLELRCNSPDVGESKVEIPIEYKGESAEIGLNPDYVIDFMKVIDAENKAELLLKDGNTAAVFKVGNNCTYVVMPMDLER